MKKRTACSNITLPFYSKLPYWRRERRSSWKQNWAILPCLNYQCVLSKSSHFSWQDQLTKHCCDSDSLYILHSCRADCQRDELFCIWIWEVSVAMMRTSPQMCLAGMGLAFLIAERIWASSEVRFKLSLTPLRAAVIESAGSMFLSKTPFPIYRS